MGVNRCSRTARGDQQDGKKESTTHARRNTTIGVVPEGLKWLTAGSLVKAQPRRRSGI